MANYDLINCDDRVIIDVCDDSDEAERVRVTRKKAGFIILSVMSCGHADFIEVKRSKDDKLSPKRVYKRPEGCWIVTSVIGGRPAKLVLSEGDDD